MIHQPAIQRMLDGIPYDQETLKLIFEQLSDSLPEDSEGGQYAAMFIDEKDEFVVGTYVPELWFVLRKVLPDDQNSE